MPLSRASKERFWNLFEESVIIQSLVTLLVTFIWGALALAPLYMRLPDGTPYELAPSKEVWAIIGLVYGYWFGTKKDLAHRKELEQQQATVNHLVAVIAAKVVPKEV